MSARLKGNSAVKLYMQLPTIFFDKLLDSQNHVFFCLQALCYRPAAMQDARMQSSRGSFVCRQVFYTQSLQEAEPVKGAPEAVTTLAMTCDWLVAGTEAGTICQWSTHARTGLR